MRVSGSLPGGFLPREVRYVRVRAEALAVCPDWHPGKGTPGWLFVDEIVVE